MLARNLPQLSTLEVRGCEKVEQIIVDGEPSSSSSAQGHDDDETSSGVKNDKDMLIFPQLQSITLKGLPSLTSFSPMGYHLLFPSLYWLVIQDYSQMNTNFTVDSTSMVHAKTKCFADTSPWELDTSQLTCGPSSLLPYVEDADKI
ncbi:hypothetical protein PTKIN_Ptkin14bG0195000 [Pterospermum kingtungense]